ncbi:hypothetical protein TNCV_431221 [Trichonephila clavipes]|nr:hypothetical protein TNCV_431221 [Trichonephila clavipes]
MTSDYPNNCSKLWCVVYVTADTEERKTKRCLQTNPGTWGFQMFSKEEIEKIGEHGNQTGPRFHFTTHNIKSYYPYGLNVIWKGESVLLAFKQESEDSLYIPNFDKYIDNSNNIRLARISRAKRMKKSY